MTSNNHLYQSTIRKVMVNLLTLLYLAVSIILIGFILMQQGKGADAGASFGGGASGTVFGAQGSANFLSRTTAVLTVVFFSISLIIGNLNTHHEKVQSQFEDLSGVEQSAPVPAVKKEDSKTSEIPE